MSGKRKKTLPDMQINFSLVIGLSVELDEKEYGYRARSDQPAGERDRIGRKMTQKFEKTTHQVIYCAEPLVKGDLKSKKGMETIPLSEYDPDKDSHHSYSFTCNQLRIYAAVCVFGLIRSSSS